MKETYWDKTKLDKNYHYEENFVLQSIVHFILNNECESVFEAAVGSGIIPTMLRKRGFAGRYLGSDYCSCFLKAAKENNQLEQFIEADLANEISLPDKSFDVSVVNHGLDYVYPYKTALEELKRITRHFVIITFWQGFIEKNSIRFNEEKGWQVNNYEKEEWERTLKEVGLTKFIDAEFFTYQGKTQRYNHLIILKP